MDADRFDTLLREFVQRWPRRSLLGSLSSLVVAGALAGGPARLAAANPKKKHQKKHHKRNKKNHGKKKDDCNPPCAGTLCCDGKCVDVLRDRNNCGECGHQCDVAQFCQNTVCVPCDEPMAVCTVAGEDHCVNVATDPNNCGSCGNECRKDPSNPARNLVCQDRKCICTGKTCNNGQCCPKDFSICIGDGIGCCPDDFPVPCNNGRCCPAGYSCGGSCGQPCCKGG